MTPGFTHLCTSLCIFYSSFPVTGGAIALQAEIFQERKKKCLEKVLEMSLTGHFKTDLINLGLWFLLNFLLHTLSFLNICVRRPCQHVLQSECTLHSGKLINYSPLHPPLFIHLFFFCFFFYLCEEYMPHSFNTLPSLRPSAYSLGIQINQYLL